MNVAVTRSALVSLALLGLLVREAPAQCQSQNLQQLVVPDSIDFDAVGTAVALDGTRAVVGVERAWFQGPNSGVAHVFEFDGAGWSLDATLHADDPIDFENFGAALDVDGERVVVGAPGGTPEVAYVFELAAGSWELVALLTGSPGRSGTDFGTAVAIDGDLLVAGAPYDSEFLPNAGAAFVFERIAGEWVQVAKLAGNDLVVGAHFGGAVALDGERLVVGAAEAPGGASSEGAAYVFERLDGEWVQVAKLVPSDGQGQQQFGRALAVAGDTIVVGQPLDGTEVGSAYVYHRVGGVWTQQAKLVSSSPEVTGQFGAAVTEPDLLILVGEPFGFPNTEGAVYLFELRDEWQQVAVLASPAAQAFDEYGYAVALSGGLALVGAPDLYKGTSADSAWALATCTWKDLGGALAGSAGAALLAGNGTLLQGSHDVVTLFGAAPSAAALLFVALGEPGAQPFKGGVLQAFPVALLLPAATDPSGSIGLGFDMPAGFSGSSFVLQWAVADAGAPAGAALSNALRGQVP